MHIVTKKVIIYSIIALVGISSIQSYNTPTAHELVTESFEVLTVGQQLIRVDVTHQCGDWIHFALDETVVPETMHYVTDELELIADTIIVFTEEYGDDVDEAGCTINELELTLIGVGM